MAERSVLGSLAPLTVCLIARVVVLATLLWTSSCLAQTSTDASDGNAAAPVPAQNSHCKGIDDRDPRLSMLSTVCQFALSYRRDLPDFICEQTTTTVGPEATTVLKAEVTFQKGGEHYSKITINDKPANATSFANVLKFISAGELGSDLVNLFKAPIAADFHLPKEARLGRTPSLIYQFHVAAEKNTFWMLRDRRGITIHPEYEGKLWLGRKDGRLLRIEWWPVHLPGDFGIASVDVTIDYNEISVSGLGAFLLPSRSVTTVCESESAPVGCRKNVLVFHDCHKFATKTRVITDLPARELLP